MKLRIFAIILVFVVLLSGCSTPQKPDDPIYPPETVEGDHQLQFDSDKDGIYNYCPVAFEEDANTRYIYYCTNQKSKVVIDYVGCRKGTRNLDGTWTWGEEVIVLAPTEGTWDAHHTCDPSILAGKFDYKGETYEYLMSYLGCTSWDNQDNKIGLAVSHSPTGPFIKVGTEPLVDFVMEETSAFQWGVGQTSMISLDCEGKILLFYTRGDKRGTRTIVEEWDLRDLENPVCLRSEELERDGVGEDGTRDYTCNADVLFDLENNRYFFTSDGHPYPREDPNFISAHFRVQYFENELPFGSQKWETLALVGEEETGFPRNHNTGFLRDRYGYLPSNGFITVYYTMSILGGESLWSYRIYDFKIELPE